MRRLLARAVLVGVVCLMGLSGTASGMSRSRMRTSTVRQGHPQGGVPSLASVRIGNWIIVPIRLPFMGFSVLILSGEAAGKGQSITSTSPSHLDASHR